VTALFRSELLKLRTTRTATVLAGGLFAITAISVVAAMLLTDELDSETQADIPSTASFAVLFAILFGILVMTAEFRHGTATPTFLVSPKREQVLLAKTGAAVVGGLALALAALVLVYLVAVPWLLAAGDDVYLFEREPLRSSLALVAACAIWGALGVGIGAVVRSQVGAIVGALVWFLIVENLVGAIWDDVAPYLPGGAIGAVFEASPELGSWAGAAVSAGYALAFCLVGTVLTVRRDLT
jgi:ABC-2 type transport system permease protein